MVSAAAQLAGGLREALADGRVTEETLARFRSALSDTFATVPRLQLCLLTGEQEGSWEREAAHTVWGRDVSTMFPAGDDAAGDADEVSAFGLFSGGGQSMQVCACCVARAFSRRGPWLSC